ncbi:MAG: NmrA family protein [Gemmatimonadetes bacterium]|nr:NmrA family protein [Gemmatimonadota bacterium]
MILVAGATGLLGSEICRLLREQGRPVRALVRAGSANAARLRELGVDVMVGDLRSPASVEEACRGVDAVASTATAMGTVDKQLNLRDVDRDAQLRLVEVAKASGVQRFVYVSLSPKLQPTAPLVLYKREVERALRASGMRWTILQPSVYMEVWLSAKLGWDFIENRAMIFGAGDGPMSWISVADVARYAVCALDDPRLVNRDLPLAGPEALSPNQVVKIFEELSARRFKVRRIPRPMLLLLAPMLRLFDEGIASGMAMGAQSALGDQFDTPLQRELGPPTTTVREYAARVLRA